MVARERKCRSKGNRCYLERLLYPYARTNTRVRVLRVFASRGEAAREKSLAFHLATLATKRFILGSLAFFFFFFFRGID